MEAFYSNANILLPCPKRDRENMSENRAFIEPREIVAFVGNPWEELDGLFERVQRDFLPGLTPAVPWAGPKGAAAFAATDFEKQKTAYEIHADLPGFSKENIDVRVQGRQV